MLQAWSKRMAGAPATRPAPHSDAGLTSTWPGSKLCGVVASAAIGRDARRCAGWRRPKGGKNAADALCRPAGRRPDRRVCDRRDERRAHRPLCGGGGGGSVGLRNQPRPPDGLRRAPWPAGNFELPCRTGDGRAEFGGYHGTTACADISRLRPHRQISPCPYYQGAGVAVYRLAADGTVGAASQQWLATATGAHAIATDRSNRFAFVPHIARLQDNVLEPPKNDPGPNMILQFRFDPQQGQLAPNAPFRLEPPGLLGPRHFCFHPSLDVVYFSNEQGCSVTAYRLDPTSGTLTAMQTAPTLPAGFSGRNTCSQIHLTPSGRFLYVGNRGHNSIAAFAVDAGSGELSLAGHAATEAVPSAFCLDRDGRFLFAAGTASGRLAAYRIDAAAGTLSPLDSYAVGRRPAAVLAVGLSG